MPFNIPLPPKGSSNVYEMHGNEDGQMLVRFHKDNNPTDWYLYPEAGTETIRAFQEEAEKLEGSTGKLFATTLRKSPNPIKVTADQPLTQGLVPVWAAEIIRASRKAENKIEEYKESMNG